jgi:hypothetical protein
MRSIAIAPVRDDVTRVYGCFAEAVSVGPALLQHSKNLTSCLSHQHQHPNGHQTDQAERHLFRMYVCRALL